MSCFLRDTDLAVLKSQAQRSEHADNKYSIYWSAQILMLFHDVLSRGVRIGVWCAMGATRVTGPIIYEILKSYPHVTRFGRFHVSVL